jgi:FAD synthetase
MPIRSLDEISLSYNGGKDCLVLLILLLSSLSTHSTRTNTPLPSALQSVYQLNLARYAMNMKEAFGVYLQDHKEVKAILVGTRRTDPHGGSLTHFDQTDKGWPAFMRVHPVIDWHYAEIWTVSLHFHIPSYHIPLAFPFLFYYPFPATRRKQDG